MKAFVNALVYVYGEGIKKTNVLFDGKIRAIGDGESVEGAEEIKIPDGCIVLPGFIDRHVHGAGGADAMDASTDALAVIADTLAKEGTVRFAATTMTQSHEKTAAACKAAKEYTESGKSSGAAVLGVHLEGPFISPIRKGAQPEEYIIAPSVEEFDSLNKASGNHVVAVTFAPETSGADKLVEHLRKLHISASIGHTDATYADVERAASLGANCVTHTFNAMSALAHREAGVVGGAMLIDSLFTELICDTVHVSVPAMRLLYKCKPSGKVVLVTDSIRAKGLGDGESELGGQKVIVRGDEARLESGALAGSVLRMNKAVRNLAEKVGAGLCAAADCASINPARSLGIDSECGSIEVGKCADFAVIDKDYNVVLTVRDGNIVYIR